MKEHRVSPKQIHEVIFVIKQRNIDVLTRLLDDISDPTSPNYGNHMTAEEIAAISGNPTARDAVLSYLSAAGATVTKETLFSEYITAEAPVSIWEGMFDTEFFSFAIQPVTHGGSIRPAEVVRYIRSEKYSVPVDLDDHVESVMNTVQMPPMNPKKVTPRKMKPKTPENALDFDVEETLYITPAVLISGYNVDVSVTHPRATQAVFETNNDFYSPADLKQFQIAYGVPLTPVNTSVYNHSASAAYCNANIDGCAESNLDVQHMIGLSRSPTIHYYSTLGLSSTWLAMVAATPSPPKVISISYGCDEAYVGVLEAAAFSTQSLKLGLMGTTIVVASGDDGAPSWYARSDLTKCKYTVMWPASCPYVTSVGATMVSSYYLI
jgi:tripeptidyl-peptidase I